MVPDSCSLVKRSRQTLAGCKVHTSLVKHSAFVVYPAEKSQIIGMGRGEEKAILRLINDSKLVKKR